MPSPIKRREGPRIRLLNGGRFQQQETDPLSGFANLMDVMLVFALGLMIALLSQSDDLKRHFALTDVEVSTSDELVELPTQGNSQGKAAQGMESVGTVYRDPTSGKLILIGN